MGTRFTRVTIVGDGRQLDVSLPSEDRLSLHMSTVLRLLAVPAAQTPGRWRLAHPATGVLAPDRSLSDSGVLDGTRLHLVTTAEAPAAPFVDDIEDTVAALVADASPAWAGVNRRRAVGWLLLPVLLGLLVSSLSPDLVILGPVAALLMALAAGITLPGAGGAAAAVAIIPAAVLLLVGLEQGAGLHFQGPLVPATVVGLGSLVAALTRRHLTAILATTLFTGACLLALCGVWFGLPADRLAGLGLVLSVLLAGLAGQLALGSAGLVDLMVADEQGHRAPRSQVVQSTMIGRAVATGTSWGAASVATPAIVVLAFSAGWVPPTLAGLGCLILLLRSRLFSRTSEVLPQLLAAVAGLVALVLQLVSRQVPPLAVLLILVAVAAGVLATGLVTLHEVTAARISRILDRVEFLAVILLIPGVVLLFDVFTMVRAWVS